MTQLPLQGKKAIAITADVTNKESLVEAVAKTEAELGDLAIAVNSAGIANANPAEEMSEDQFQTLMDINLKGVFLSCQAEANAMLKHGKGAIVKYRLHVWRDRQPWPHAGAL